MIKVVCELTDYTKSSIVGQEKVIFENDTLDSQMLYLTFNGVKVKLSKRELSDALSSISGLSIW